MILSLELALGRVWHRFECDTVTGLHDTCSFDQLKVLVCYFTLVVITVQAVESAGCRDHLAFFLAKVAPNESPLRPWTTDNSVQVHPGRILRDLSPVKIHFTLVSE